jgi:hypothetical protein
VITECDETMCKCGKAKAEPLHSCPYREELFDDYEDSCRCCDACLRECLYDI